MKEFSMAMALVDFIPVILFTAAAIILQRDLYCKMSKGAFAVFACGTIDVAAAGALKALYKLLYAANICDFQALSDIFMPLQSIGFLLAGVAVLAYVFRKPKDQAAAAAVAPPFFKGTFVFIGLMVAGLAAMLIGLSAVAVRNKKYLSMVLFIVGLICSICMGYLSSRDFDLAIYNWIAEGVNVIGQGAILGGVLILHKALKKDDEPAENIA